MRQYLKIKEEHRDCMLFFRLGDFYEMFGEDAKLASRELDIMLTTRDRTKENPEDRTPMCGVPYHSAEAYIARLIAKGYKVAICEQMEDPATAKGLVDRDVVRIITPGTLIDTSMLDEGKPNYLCSLTMEAGHAAACFADLSTGEISVTVFDGADVGHILSELGAFSPAEAVIDQGAEACAEVMEFLKERLNCLLERGPERFAYNACFDAVSRQFGKTPGELGIAGEECAVRAVGALLTYMNETQKADLSHINTLKINAGGKYMELDYQTLRSLELVSAMNTGEKKGSLLWVLDRTKTAMGRRLIRSWVLRPLLSPVEIQRRLAAVEELYEGSVMRGELIEALRGVADVERIAAKIVYGTANCRDLRMLHASIATLPAIRAQLSEPRSNLLRSLRELDALADIGALIDSAVCEDPPFSVREGGMIRTGYDEQVDYLRGLLDNSADALAQIEAREHERTGKKLKVGYNRVFGYYIEIPRSSSEDVPADYVRNQTLANTERFITQELKELETTLLTARDRLQELEFQIFTRIREQIASQITRLQDTAQAVAVIDCLCSLAQAASDGGYCMPEVDASGVIDIKDGRHPVVEQMQKNTLFVPNDTRLDREASCAIITGPNMAGKSTYMRQTALIVLMAQMGSFVPARAARIGVVDRVFTRIGASDDLAAGQSTFMVEMTEMAAILHRATPSSLLILDEIGRGTSTYDGMAIARAVLEHCADKRKLGAKTMFATHYHELSALEGALPGVKNYNITAKKQGGDVIFLRKIVPGGADDSYGIEVAGLAGVPESVIRRAKAVLKSYVEQGTAPVRSGKDREPAPADEQLSLGDMGASRIADKLRATDVNTLTPIEALNLLYHLQQLL
jgi:DNA mismatch repair protein MutS